MAAITRGEAAHLTISTVVLRTAVIGLTLATAAIHFSLGGLLFLANAAGYTVLALAMVAPGPTARWRWLVRLALIAFTAATIGGWVAFGPRFGLAYLDKALEVGLIGVLLLELWHIDGGPVVIYRRVRQLLHTAATFSFARTAR